MPNSLLQIVGQTNAEEGIATELEEFGVSKSDIILAFHSPSIRQFTEFAVG